MRHRLVVVVETANVEAAANAARSIAWGGVGLGLLLLVGSGIGAYLLIRRVRPTVSPPVTGHHVEHAQGADRHGAGGAYADGSNDGLSGVVQAARQGGNGVRWALLAALVVALLLVGARVLVFTPAGASGDAAPPGTTVTGAPAATPSGTATDSRITPSQSIASPSPRPSANRSSPPAAQSLPPQPQPPVTTGPGAPTVLCVPPDCPAQATFEPSNDRLTICDLKPDGFAGVAVYTRSDVAGQKKLWASRGNGTCENESLNMAPGAKITFKVCIGDQSENRIDRCSNETTVTA